MIVDLPKAEMKGGHDALESSCSANNAVLDNTARCSIDTFNDAQSESDTCNRDTEGASDAQDPSKEELSTSAYTSQLLGPTKCKALVVNYISTGYVLLPYAFYTAGIVYSVLILALVALQSYITSIFILDSYVRAERVHQSSFEGTLPYRISSIATPKSQYELSGLQNTFLGPKWTMLFTAMTALDLYSISWMLAAIFGHALAAKIPIPLVDNCYRFWVGVFMLITVPLSCTRILDQALLQFAFLAGRMIMVLLMVVTLIAAFASSDGTHFGEQHGPTDHVPMFNVKNTMTIVQTAIFSTAFQFSVPSLVGITTGSCKGGNNMTEILKHAVTFVFVSNCVLAIMVAMYFGSSVEQSSNLNWSKYHAGSEGWSRLASGYITMFAALDGLAIFPLLCSTLGGILAQTAKKKEVIRIDDDDFKTRIFFRLLAALPPSIGALYVQDLGVLAKYGCIFTLLSYSAAPAALYLASSKKMDELQLPKSTPYSSRYFSHNWLAYVILALTVLAILGVILETVSG